MQQDEENVAAPVASSVQEVANPPDHQELQTPL